MSIYDIESGAHVALAAADSTPSELINRLVKRLTEDKTFSVTLHFQHASAALEALFAPEYEGRVNFYSYFFSGVERSHPDQVNFVPCNYREIGKLMLANGVTHLMLAMRSDGTRLSYGACYGYSAELIESCKVAAHVELNEALPFTFSQGRPMFIGDARITTILEGPACIHYHGSKAPSKIEKEIASHILPYIGRDSVIQAGVGGVPNAVLEAINSPIDSIWSELFCPAMVRIVEGGFLPYGGTVSFTLAMGPDQKFYDFLDHNRRVEGVGVEVLNDPHQIAQSKNVVSINNALEVSLAGEVNSEQRNWSQFSGSGGQLDFVLGATMSRGGRSFICIPSTYTDRNGEVRSKITNELNGCITVPRSCVDAIVTEYGVAELRGKSESQRVQSLINIAHPDFRCRLVRGDA